MDKPTLILTTVGSEQQAITIAEELIDLELAACVNILPTMRSIYRSNGKIYDDEENMLVIQTTALLFDDVANTIRQMHSYPVPEIQGIPIDQCEGDFADWVNQNVKNRLLAKEDNQVE